MSKVDKGKTSKGKYSSAKQEIKSGVNLLS